MPAIFVIFGIELRDLLIAPAAVILVVRRAAAAAFAEAAIRLLSDGAAWSGMHAAALARGPGPDWDAVAARFEALAPQGAG